MFLEIWNFINGSSALLLTFFFVAIVDNFYLRPSYLCLFRCCSAPSLSVS
jgi:hypothetical protein